MDYSGRRERLYDWLDQNEVGAALLKKDSDVRYYTGMPSDSLLFLFRDRHCVLVPWDHLLASRIAQADEIVPYNDFERSMKRAVKGIIERNGIAKVGTVEVPSDLAYPRVMELREALPGVDVACREDGVDRFVARQRQVKDAEELVLLSRAAQLTNTLFADLESAIAKGSLSSEVDVAMFIEQTARSMGADGTGFETISAGPGRSFGIHAFPTYTAAQFGGPGLSIVDFGVKVEGYTSDITFTVVRGKTSDLQEKMIRLVQEAYELSVQNACEGAEVKEVARAVADHFAAEGMSMPHSLGHGVGLDVHEAPWLRTSGEEETILEPGMVFTLEPGLYDLDAGGVRLENDVALLPEGAVVLTNSRILRLP